MLSIATLTMASLGVFHTVHFTGGSPIDFVNFYKSHCRANVVMLASSYINAISMQVSVQDDEPASKRTQTYLEKVLGFQVSSAKFAEGGSQNYVFRPKAMPLCLMPGASPTEISAYESQFRSANMIPELSKGRVMALDNNAGYLKASTLEGLSFNKPVKVHWFLKRLRVAVSGEFATESEFINCIAYTIGGKVIDKGSYIFIDLDVERFRQLMVSRLQEELPGIFDEFDCAYWDITIGFYQQANSTILSSMMAKEDSNAQITVLPASPLGKLVLRLVDKMVNGYPGSVDSVRTTYSEIIKNVNFDKPFIILGSAQRGVKVRLRMVGDNAGVFEP